MFNPGDLVTWTSTSGGYDKTKTGTFLGIVPPGRDALTLLVELTGIEKPTNVKFDRYSGSERALVRVPLSDRSVAYYAARMSMVKNAVDYKAPMDRAALDAALKKHSPYGKRHDEVLAQLRRPQVLKDVICNLWINKVPEDDETALLRRAWLQLMDTGEFNFKD